MEISASVVKELREKTGVGMMDCKKALTETNGDFEAAIKYLREKGFAKAANKADRETKEGRVFTAATDKRGAIVEINCETDFVGKNDIFLNFGNTICNMVLQNSAIQTLEDLTAVSIEGQKISEVISDLVFKLGENISIKRIEVVTSDGTVSNYTHSNGKIGVLVGFQKPVDKVVAKDIAMHIAAMNPTYITRTDVPASIVESEKEIIKQQSLNEGKPANFVDKIVEGRIVKFYKEICLVEQEFVKDPKQSVSQLLPGNTVTQFIRYAF